MEFPRIYKDAEIDLGILFNSKVGIIGYGNQGRAQALNLKQSGLDVVIGLRENSVSALKVHSDELRSFDIDSVINECNIISLLIPDEVMREVYKKYIHHNLRKGQTLLFSHGYNIHYNLINPPSYVNVVMIAPSGAGVELRKSYLSQKGIPGVFAVYQDSAGNAEQIVLAYSKAIGLTKAGVIKTSFKEETETDLFGEQGVLTGSIPRIIQLSFKVLVDSGYSPALAWLVCYYELKTIIDMFHSNGFEFLYSSISGTAEYGGMTRGDFIIDKKVEFKLKKVLEEIQSKKFHNEWIREHKKGYPKLKELRKKEKDSQIEIVSRYMLKELFGENKK